MPAANNGEKTDYENERDEAAYRWIAERVDQKLGRWDDPRNLDERQKRIRAETMVRANNAYDPFAW